MKNRIFISCIITLLGACLAPVKAQDLALKTNGLYWLSTSINGGVEFAGSDKVTFELTGAYNPWTFKDDKKMRFWLAQPQVKYWLCEKFEGHFFGAFVNAAQFFGGFKQTRYDGYMAGFGITYGYDWILSPHWNLEAEIGVGYERLWYKESPRIPCTKCKRSRHKNYVGPNKASVSIMYIF